MDGTTQQALALCLVSTILANHKNWSPVEFTYLMANIHKTKYFYPSNACSLICITVSVRIPLRNSFEEELRAPEAWQLYFIGIRLGDAGRHFRIFGCRSLFVCTASRQAPRLVVPATSWTSLAPSNLHRSRLRSPTSPGAMQPLSSTNFHLKQSSYRISHDFCHWPSDTRSLRQPGEPPTITRPLQNQFFGLSSPSLLEGDRVMRG